MVLTVPTVLTIRMILMTLMTLMNRAVASKMAPRAVGMSSADIAGCSVVVVGVRRSEARVGVIQWLQ